MIQKHPRMAGLFSKSETMCSRALLTSPQFVSPYVKSNKNDANDADGIAEVCRPTMRFVGVKRKRQEREERDALARKARPKRKRRFFGREVR